MGHPDRHKPERPLRIGGWLPYPRRNGTRHKVPAPASDSDATQQLMLNPDDTMINLDPAQRGSSGPGQGGRPRSRRCSQRWLRIAAPAAVLITVGIVAGASRFLLADQTPDHDLARSASPVQPGPEPPGVSASLAASVTARAGRLSPEASPATSALVSPTKAASTPTRPPAPSQARPQPVSYEAETAGLSGAAWPQSGPNGSKVIVLDRNGAVEFNVSSPAARDCQITITYASDRKVTGSYRINNGPDTPLWFASSGGASRLTTTTITVKLKAGSNKVWIGNSSYSRLLLDKITVT